MKKIRWDRVIIFLIGVILVSFICFSLIKTLFVGVVEQFTNDKKIVASTSLTVPLYDFDYNEIIQIKRGEEVTILKDNIINNEQEYSQVKYDKNEYYILSSNLVDDINDAVLEKEMYVRTSVTLYENLESIKIKGLVEKGEKLEILGFNSINDDGSVDMYKVKYNEQEGYVYGKYLVNNYEESILNYDEEGIYQIHKKRGDSWGGGDAGTLDYYPYEKPKFENNVMPSEVRSLYMDASAVSNVDEYIKLAKESGINAIVVDIKDGIVAYPANAMKEYSITNYNRAINSYEEYKNAIKKIKDAGLYVIGRITTFKDSNYATDHPEDTILDTATGKSYNHDGSYWPSAFSRDVWEFNVSLAIESVKEMGFNEIQFDYVRFPDRVQSLEKAGKIDYNNTYNESKAQAIQRFVMYACDEIHKYGAYVSIDVFGEAAHTYVTPYGQYWPAISNVADVISGMPYPDHFGKYDYNFKEPVWTIPYDLLYKWGNEFVVNRQKEIPTPAIVRTWIQAYDAIKEPKVIYDADMVSKEIQGLYDAGLTGGFITWNGSSSLTKYKEISSAFGKEY
ncbi:MAG TPA: hypothetical protein IAC20_04460 [Candidatus Faecisoma merdavium]|nr:hypothetical protein [Candidatus Faecisoma merdavium]